MPFFCKVVLSVILLAYFIAACVLTHFKTRDGYANGNDEAWVMIGGLRSDEATFRIRRISALSNDSFVVATDADLTNKVFDQGLSTNNAESNTKASLATDSARLMANQIASVSVSGLNPNTQYHYARISGDGDVVRQGTFRTAPEEGQRTDFTFAASACAWTGSTSEVFTKIRKDHNPLFFLHTGDIHYEGLDTDDVSKRIKAIDRVMGSSTQRDLYANTPLSYMWDDHDFRGDNLGGEGVGRDAALDSYRLAFPYTPVNTTSAEPLPVYNAFTIGTVRFIISDLRSESSPGSMYSNEQRDWLFNELSKATDYDFVVWVTTKPWIVESTGEADADDWSAAPQDRRDLSDQIRQFVPNNLLAISADAHMLAFDDGSNTYFGSATEAEASSIRSFPLLQSGPLDRLGSFKGGPYSNGCHAYRYERNHQFSIINFVASGRDDGDGPPCLEIEAFSYGRSITTEKKTSRIFSRRMCGSNVEGDAGIFARNDPGKGSCSEKLLSPINLSAVIISIGLLVANLIATCWLGDGLVNQIVVDLLLIFSFVSTFGIAFLIPFARGINQFDAFEAGVLSVAQMGTAFLFLCGWMCCGGERSSSKY